MTEPDLITAAEAAKLLGIKPRALRADRESGRLLFPYVRLGPKTFRYPRGELLRIVEECTVRGAR